MFDSLAPFGRVTRRVYVPQGRTGGTRFVTPTRALSPSTHRQCPQCAKHHGAYYRVTLQRHTDARADEAGTDDLAGRGDPGTGGHQSPQGLGLSAAPEIRRANVCTPVT